MIVSSRKLTDIEVPAFFHIKNLNFTPVNMGAFLFFVIIFLYVIIKFLLNIANMLDI